MGEDAIGLARFRERYLGKMGEGPNARAFEVITAPIEAAGTEFAAIVRSIAAVDTLEAFLRDLRARYPETGAAPSAQRANPPPPAPAASNAGSNPRGVGGGFPDAVRRSHFHKPMFLIAVGSVLDCFLAIGRDPCGILLKAVVVQDVAVGGGIVITAHPKANKIPISATVSR